MRGQGAVMSLCCSRHHYGDLLRRRPPLLERLHISDCTKTILIRLYDLAIARESLFPFLKKVSFNLRVNGMDLETGVDFEADADTLREAFGDAVIFERHDWREHG